MWVMVMVAQRQCHTSRALIWEQLSERFEKHYSVPLFSVLPELGSVDSVSRFRRSDKPDMSLEMGI